jgi:predicted component of type VI protein secretion system
MPYIVVNSDHQDVDCRELDGSLVIGRAPDCQVSVRDILLSRRHCRIEKSAQGWLLIDLNSKNGTAINGERLIAPRLLNNNDIVRMGRSRVVFHTGVPGEEEIRRPESPRPIDPHEALAGTMAGFTLLAPGEEETPRNMPCPQPKPKDPEVFQREELHELLTAIASSSWDSIYAEARLPKTKTESAPVDNPRQRPHRPRSPIDLSLQVSLIQPPEPNAIEAEIPQEIPTEIPATSPSAPAPPLVMIPAPQPAWRSRLRFAAAVFWVAAGLMMMTHATSTHSVPIAHSRAPAPVVVAAAPMTVSPLPRATGRPALIIFSDAQTWDTAARTAELSLPHLIW